MYPFEVYFSEAITKTKEEMVERKYRASERKIEDEEGKEEEEISVDV